MSTTESETLWSGRTEMGRSLRGFPVGHEQTGVGMRAAGANCPRGTNLSGPFNQIIKFPDAFALAQTFFILSFLRSHNNFICYYMHFFCTKLKEKFSMR